MWGGGGGVIFFLHFMLFPTFLENINSGNIFVFFCRKTIVDRDSGNLYPIYIQKIVVLASEPVGGRSRAIELPCLELFCIIVLTGQNLC